MKKIINLLILLLVFGITSYAQQPFCNDAEPFCTDSVYNYPLATGTSSETGPDYGCLLTQPNPVWYFLQISVAGNINIHMESTPGVYDIDFICWGPFTTATGACTAGLTAGNTVDCSYSTASVEDCYIPNAQVGEFYMFLLTNYSNSTTDVEFSSGTSTGETDCSIVVPCTMTNITVNVGPCDPVTNTYDITGTIVYINPPATGSLIIEDDAGPGFFDSFIPTPNFFSPTNFSITGIPADGLTHTLYSYFTDDGCNYTITYTAPAPCMGCVTPPGSITATTPDCYDSPITFTYVPGTVDPGATYVWNFGTGATLATANTVGPHTVTYSTSGSTPNITLTVTDPTCAPNVINISVTIPPEITVSSSGSTPEVCGSSDGAISVTATGGTGALSYNIGSGGQATGNFTSLLAGPYTITITDVNGCTITELVTVGTSGSVASGFTTSIDQCLIGNSFNFTNTGDTGGGITWTWSFSGGTPSSSANENPTGVTWTIPGQYDVTQTTHLGGCNDTDTLTIEVFEMPFVTVITTDETCVNLCDGTATANPLNGNNPYTYEWNTTDITQTIIGLCPNNYDVTITDANNCTSINNGIVNAANPINIDNFLFTEPSCNGNIDGTITTIASGGCSPITYSLGGITNQTGQFFGLGADTYNVTITDCNNCSVTQEIIITEPNAIVIDNQSFTNSTCYNYDDGTITINASGGIGTLTYNFGSYSSTSGNFVNLSPDIYNITITDDNGCSITTPFTLIEPDEIIVNITPNQTICNGANANISVTIIGGNPPYNYLWAHMDNTPNIIVSPTSNTSYVCQVTDVNGCLGNVVSTVVNIQPGVNLTVIPTDASLCIGEKVYIELVGSSGVPPYVITYNGNTITTPYFHYPNQSETITFTITDMCGSIDDASIDFTVYDLPIVSFSSDIISGCVPLTVSFNSSNNGNLLWNFGDNSVSYSNSPIYEYNESGIYDVTLQVSDSNNCVNTQTINNLIYVYKVPKAAFIADPQIVSIINPTIYFNNYSEGAIKYYWDFGDESGSTMINPYHVYPTYPTGTYNVQLIAESDKGCRDTVYMEITITNEYTFYAPTAFSPDFDGINDYFRVFGNGINTKSNFTLYVFDRWGEIIFETNDINEGWNGRVRNNSKEIVKNGVYTWLCKFKLDNDVYNEHTGVVTLIR